jgi:hypothetical protein
MSDRLTRFRDVHPELDERFVDVDYRELIADPLAVMKRIHRRCDLKLTPEAAGRIRHLASRRSRYRARRSTPSLADIGLDELTLAGLVTEFPRPTGQIPAVRPGLWVGSSTERLASASAPPRQRERD